MMVNPSREFRMASVDWQPQVLESYRWEHPREGLRFPSAPLCVWHYAGTQAESNPSSRCILLGSRGFLKIHVEMAFEEYTCMFSTLPQSPLLSYQAPSFCCLPGFSGQFCVWPFFYIQVTNIMKRFWIWTQQTPITPVVAYCAGTSAGWGLFFLFSFFFFLSIAKCQMFIFLP